MKVKYIEETSGKYLTTNAIYEVILEKGNYYHIIDNTKTKGVYSKNKFEIVKESNNMKKSDLQTGMILELKDDNRRYLFINEGYYKMFAFNDMGWLDIDLYNDDLTHINKQFTITKIYKPKLRYAYYKGTDINSNTDNLELIWERKDNSKEINALKIDITNIENTLKEMKSKLTALESEE